MREINNPITEIDITRETTHTKNMVPNHMTLRKGMEWTEQEKQQLQKYKTKPTQLHTRQANISLPNRDHEKKTWNV